MRDYQHTYNGIMTHIEDKISGKYFDLLDDEEMHFMSKFVAAIPMKYVAKTLQGTTTITAKDGDCIEATNLKYFIKIVCELPVSKYMQIKTMKDTFFNSAMPYFLYCHKLHNGTPYLKWANHPHIKLLLGKHLRPLVTLSNKQIGTMLHYDTDYKMKMRTMTLLRAGKAQPVTGWCLVKSNQDIVFDSLPKCVRLMILQTWLLNVSLRNKYMILDPHNWDMMPDAIDEYVTLDTGQTVTTVNGLEVGDIL